MTNVNMALRAFGQAILDSPRVKGDIERAKAVLDVNGSGSLSSSEIEQGLAACKSIGTNSSLRRNP